MWQVLASDTEVFLQAGFIYTPMLFDPDIQRELTAAAPDEFLIQTERGYFIQSLSLSSLVENYSVIFPEQYGEAQTRLRRAVSPGTFLDQPPLNARLRTIIFEILPHFLRPPRSQGWRQRKALPILARLAAKVLRHIEDCVYLDRLREQEAGLQQALRRLEESQPQPQPLPDGLRSARDLIPWFQEALRGEIISQEIAFCRQRLTEVQNLLDLPALELAALLAITARGTAEVDGVGFCPDDNRPGEYLVYKRTGEFVLKDYFNRLYLFPDCRVGVSTAGPFHPMVLDIYKHPLLRRFGARQQICLNDFQAAAAFSAAGVIKALEEGLSALFYGYNSRKRNGYNSLDKFSRHQSLVDFDDWRLPESDRRVQTGELEVTNSFI